MKSSKYYPQRTLLLLTLFFFNSIISLAQSPEPLVKVGIEVLRDQNFKALEGKRVGLVTNPTGVDHSFISTVDILYQAKNVNLTALYGPEHGVRGDTDAGAHVDSNTDAVTGLPVYSLYGKTRKPTPAMLQNVDVIVYDIQDIGVRSYTFISTLGLVMEAAAENNKEVIVLDRPNPLGGTKIEGNIVEPGYFSFVSQFPIPYIYGLTVGELAYMMNYEEWLKNKTQCKLNVIPMKGWKRDMRFKDTGRHWIPTSPHIPFPEVAELYPASGIIGELEGNFIGIGYTLPFTLFGAEYINTRQFAQQLNALNLEGVYFRGLSFTPYYKEKKGMKLHGVQIYITDYDKVRLSEIQFHVLEVQHKLHATKDLFNAHKDRWTMFDKVCGSNKIREGFMASYSFAGMKDYWRKDEAAFRKKAAVYLMYR
ncbi:exo-beta-N-acetylmuramidase NamZ domain-containing protein [Flammeovirga sp. SJP92]|uniref:exo-beta-N-acetylmuramidase NamZ family protein n=1 Tax=Flammeovirga sp. SJP92 TaxID=1775430 RepID=UPI00078756E9|nr:DUF1343 domain-containing protein [Flammeovirga sp. SJP92]KXX72633.1 hypothetical protein AVL50_06425 [Flammeovirga sp. SJP92]